MPNKDPIDIYLIAEFEWTKRLDSSEDIYPLDIHPDEWDNYHRVGTGLDDFIYLQGVTNDDIYISKYNLNGEEEWTKFINSNSDDYWIISNMDVGQIGLYSSIIFAGSAVRLVNLIVIEKHNGLNL